MSLNLDFCVYIYIVWDSARTSIQRGASVGLGCGDCCCHRGGDAGGGGEFAPSSGDEMREGRSDAGCQKRVVFVHQSWKNPEVANSEQEDDDCADFDYFDYFDYS